LQAIRRYQEAGGIFVVCTGRMLSSILPAVRRMGIESGLVVAYQGATVADIKTGKLIKDDAFGQISAATAVRVLEELDQHVHVYTVDEMYCNRDDEPLKAYERMCGVKATVKENLTQFLEEEKPRIVKVLAMIKPEDGKMLYERLTGALGEDCFVTFSSPYMVEVTPAGNTKGAAVKYLANYYGVSVEEVAAIGDQLNDLPMIEAAGGKFTVENGDGRLKAIACVMPQCDEGGVAAALECVMKE
ncbi:MAG: HAD-IIB family hydrolase, partial [Clostridiales bacterium]|nr:HAD-IIB family hydrolase [Clostridiales bacterium]